VSNIVALIPAKGTSERIPGKNLKLLDGVPLVAWSIVTALACESIDKVVVSSDDSEILKVAEKFGAQPLFRYRELAGPQVPDLPVVEHFLESCEKVDLVVYLRPTTPLRSTGMVERAIRLLREAGTAASGLRSVHKMGESAYKCFELRPGPFLKPIVYDLGGEYAIMSDWPDQLVPPTYKPNGYVDLILPATVEGGSCFGAEVIPIITPPVIEVDNPADWDHLTCSLTTGGRGVHEFHLGPFGK
jgi:N-acylneuraminate cytidylyltransferase